MSNLVKFFTPLAMGLSLMSCGVPNTQADQPVAPPVAAAKVDSSQTVDGVQTAITFTTKDNPDMQCVYINAGRGVGLDCFPGLKGKTPALPTTAKADSVQRIDGNQEVITFTPKARPDMQCVYIFTGHGVGLDCFPKP